MSVAVAQNKTFSFHAKLKWNWHQLWTRRSPQPPPWRPKWILVLECVSVVHLHGISIDSKGWCFASCKCTIWYAPEKLKVFSLLSFGWMMEFAFSGYDLFFVVIFMMNKEISYECDFKFSWYANLKACRNIFILGKSSALEWNFVKKTF